MNFPTQISEETRKVGIMRNMRNLGNATVSLRNFPYFPGFWQFPFLWALVNKYGISSRGWWLNIQNRQRLQHLRRSFGDGEDAGVLKFLVF